MGVYSLNIMKGWDSMLYKCPLRSYLTGCMALFGILLVASASFAATKMSDSEIAKEVAKESNRAIIDEFLKYELREVNEFVTKPLLNQYPSLIFFIKQAERDPLNSLFFLEAQVHKLRDAQKNIDSLPYSIAFSSEEKKKILGLRPVADRIVSYGIPLMKRDFYRVAQAAKELAEKKRKNPMELIPDPKFRDAIYRQCEATAHNLDIAMGELSEGELICMRLGWTLDQVTITRLWLVINDNRLPNQDDYMVFRKKRSEYFQNRLKRIYGQSASSATGSLKGTSK